MGAATTAEVVMAEDTLAAATTAAAIMLVGIMAVAVAAVGIMVITRIADTSGMAFGTITASDLAGNIPTITTNISGFADSETRLVGPRSTGRSGAL
jgi:hypothetical protein